MQAGARLIRKHVAIIHAYSLMSVLQRKVVNVLLSEAMNKENHVNNGDSVCYECQISLSKLAKDVYFNSNNTRYLKNAIDDLASQKIEWNLLKDKLPAGISFLNLRVLHGSPTFYKDGTFNFSFHKVLIDLLQNPAVYGAVDLNIQSQFESKYGHSLYENSTRFLNLQKNKIIQVEVFRKLLGVYDDKYLSMREFTRNVIKPSLEEVNDRADFVVRINPLKVGKKTQGYELEVDRKKVVHSSGRDIKLVENDNILKEIKSNFDGISKHVLDNILNSYSEEYILEKIIYTKTYANKEETGFYPTPYFISALRHDYKPAKKQKDLVKPTIVPDSSTQKEDDFKLLQNDLKHWENILEHAKASDNTTLVMSAQDVVEDCKNKLQQHFSKQVSQ